MPNIEEIIRSRVFDERGNLGALARQVGISRGILSRFSRGERTIQLPTAAKLCQFFGLTLVTEPSRSPAADQAGAAALALPQKKTPPAPAPAPPQSRGKVVGRRDTALDSGPTTRATRTVHHGRAAAGQANTAKGGGA